MLQTRPTSSSSSYDKIFIGIQFVLFGFDSVSESQYRSELVRRGGIDVGRYDSICSHVIVTGHVYDDPVCVAARRDGKTIVTELWVDDCVDFGTLADASRILYRPTKDLNGIPGSECLFICLTGYQRQERDDIMKMVSLMGARFTKPLIANQVTHLICYKFEGEKYELAKKVKIKLVNHRWLEDCLKAWEILPTGDYTKSGYEVELLDAEARDSEEETEDPGTEPLKDRHATGAPNSQGEKPLPVDSRLSTLNQGMPENCQASTAANLSHTAESLPTNKRFSTPCKEMSFLAHNLEVSHQKTENIVCASGSFQNQDVKDGELTIPFDVNLQKKLSILSSDGITAITGSTSSRIDMRNSALSCSGKVENEVTKDEPSDSYNRNLKENISNGDLDISLLEARISCQPDYFQNPTDGHSLPQKRKASGLSLGSKSPKLEGQGSIFSLHNPSTTLVSAQVEPSSAKSINHRKTDISTFGGGATSNHKESPHAGPSKFKSLNYKNRSFKRGQSTVNTPDSFPSKNVQNVRQKHAPDQSMGIKNRLPLSETMVAVSSNSAGGEELDDLPHIGRKQAEYIERSMEKKAGAIENLVIDGRSKDVYTFKETALKFVNHSGDPELPATSGHDDDIVMKDLSTETAELQGRQQEEMATSPDTRDSETRKLLSTASTSACKEIAKKESSAVHIKKVISRRNLSCKPKLASVDTNKNKGVSITTEVKTVTPKKAEAQSVKPKVNTAEKLEKKETAESVPIDVVTEDKIKSAEYALFESSRKNKAMDSSKKSINPEKENKPEETVTMPSNVNSHSNGKVLCKGGKYSKQKTDRIDKLNSKDQMNNCVSNLKPDPVWFILSGHRFQRKEFQTAIRCLRGKVCRDSHNWSYQATHFVVPDPVRRTEKFFAAAAAGRWILKTDYLSASCEAGKLLEEEPYEWYRSGLTEDGTINLEAPRKWRHLREKTGHGAFYGMTIIIYGECIAPSLDTLKRVVKAGDGTILATSPPYTRFLKSGVDFALVSPSMPRVDSWVQEFLRHEIPCVLADYLVEYVCKPGYSLEKHVLYGTHSWAEKSFANMMTRSEEIVTNDATPSEESDVDISCSVCGTRDRADVMLICGDEEGNTGCGIGTHIDCCNPPLEAVPEGDWFCPKCSKRTTSKSPLKSTKKKSSSNVK